MRGRCMFPEGARVPCEMKAMDERAVWEGISTAPYERALELAVIEGNRVHALIFACRRTPSGWIKDTTRERVVIHPTHWRPWPAKD